MTFNTLFYQLKKQKFTKELEKDIASIKNTISNLYSFKFVEDNNKYKLHKHILYGKSNLVNLFRIVLFTILYE